MLTLVLLWLLDDSELSSELVMRPFTADLEVWLLCVLLPKVAATLVVTELIGPLFLLRFPVMVVLMTSPMPSMALLLVVVSLLLSPSALIVMPLDPWQAMALAVPLQLSMIRLTPVVQSLARTIGCLPRVGLAHEHPTRARVAKTMLIVGLALLMTPPNIGSVVPRLLTAGPVAVLLLPEVVFLRHLVMTMLVLLPDLLLLASRWVMWPMVLIGLLNLTFPTLLGEMSAEALRAIMLTMLICMLPMPRTSHLRSVGALAFPPHMPVLRQLYRVPCPLLALTMWLARLLHFRLNLRPLIVEVPSFSVPSMLTAGRLPRVDEPNSEVLTSLLVVSSSDELGRLVCSRLTAVVNGIARPPLTWLRKLPKPSRPSAVALLAALEVETLTTIGLRLEVWNRLVRHRPPVPQPQCEHLSVMDLMEPTP